MIKTNFTSSKFFQKLKHLSRFTILTGRGAIFLAVGFYAIKYLAIPESDLLAWILGGIALFLPIFCAGLTTFQTLKFKRVVTIKAQFDSISALSNHPVKAGLRVYNANPLPFFEIELVREFLHQGSISPRHILRGADSDLRILLDVITFPHRGDWQLKFIRTTVGDRFGLTKLSFKVPCDYSCEVDVQEIPISPLPVVASSSVSGDLIESLDNRSGDPFDLKQYDPSDGISRILWKTYAKSGELIVRRPEPSVVPDGEVAIYIIAGKKDDHVVGGFYSYYHFLQRSQIAVLFGTDGTLGEIMVNESGIHKAIKESVWRDSAGTGKDLGRFIDTLSSYGRTIIQILIFGPDDRDDWISEAQNTVARRELRVDYALVPASFRTNPDVVGASKVTRATSLRSESHTGQFYICQRSLG